MRLNKIKDRLEKEMLEKLGDEIALELGVDSVTISDLNHGSIDIDIDGWTIKDVQIDHNGNLWCSIPKQFQVEYLPLFGRILVELFPSHDFKGRANYGLHVRYFQRFHKTLTKEELKSMLRTGKGAPNDTNFREWHKEYKEDYFHVE